MNNLDDIKKQYAKNQPFKIPENYFEQFSDKMMATLPEKAKEKELKAAPVFSMWSRVKPVVYLAAMLTAAIWTIDLLTVNRGGVGSAETSAKVAERESDVVSMKLAMAVDEYSLYEYLSEEEK